MEYLLTSKMEQGIIGDSNVKFPLLEKLCRLCSFWPPFRPCDGLGLSPKEHILLQKKFCSVQGRGRAREVLMLMKGIQGGDWMPGSRLSVR